MKYATELIVICDYANLSQDGKLSVNGIFDEVYVQSFPGGIAQTYLVATIKGETNAPYKFDVKLLNIKNSKNYLNPITLTGNFGRNGKTNLIVGVNSLGFDEEGMYRFVISDGDAEVGATTLNVMHAKNQSNQKFTQPN